MSLDVALHPGVLMSGWDPERADLALRAAADSGYTRVVVPLRGFEDLDAAAIAAACRRFGLLPMAAGNQQPHADVSSDDPDVRAAGEDRLRRMVAFTRDIGGDQISGVLYGVLAHAPAPVSPQRFARTAERVGAVADAARHDGVRVVCEVVNRYETSLMNTAAQGVDFVRRSGSDNLFLHLDAFHMNIEERDVSAALRLALPHLAYVEIGQNDRGALAGGPLDLLGVVRAALDAGYRGRFGIEAFSAAVLAPPVAAALAVWRDTFDDTNAIAREGAEIFRHAEALAAAARPA
jgi:D-psicose/D-tagatose/L-ribulose 3-epimerase